MLSWLSRKADANVVSAFSIPVAEREGFEPSVRLLTVHSLSRRAPSADSAISPFLELSAVSVQLSAMLNPHYSKFMRYIIISLVQLKADG